MCMDRVGTFIDRIQPLERFIALHDLSRPGIIYNICGESVDRGMAELVKGIAER